MTRPNFDETRLIKKLPPLPPEMGAATADAIDLLTVILWKTVRAHPMDTPRQARNIATQAVSQMRSAGLIPGTGSRRSPEAVLEAFAAKGEKPIRGVSHLIAEILVLIDLDEVHKDTLMSLLPQSAKATVKVKPAIRKFDQWGWITRTQEGTIRVLDPEGLTGWFTNADDASEWRAATSLHLAETIELINAGLGTSTTDADRSLRHRELLALKRLMESSPVGNTGGRGQVRVVPRSVTV